MQSLDRYTACVSDTKHVLESTLNKVRDTMSRQGNYLLPRQLEEYNRLLSRLGLVLVPSGEVLDYASDMYKDDTKKSSRASIDMREWVLSDEPLTLDKTILERASAFSLSLSNMSLNQVLKPSISVGEELIHFSTLQTLAQLPKDIDKSIDKQISASIYRFMVGGDTVNAIYSYSTPTPKEFRKCDEYAYSLSLDTVSKARGRGM